MKKREIISTDAPHIAAWRTDCDKLAERLGDMHLRVMLRKGSAAAWLAVAREVTRMEEEAGK